MIEVRKPTEQEKKEAETWPTWSKEVSEFDWEYSDKETCLIIEGEATVTSQDEEVTFGKDDLVIFPKGLQCTWKITKDIKKYYKFG